MKKFLSMILVGALAFALTACSISELGGPKTEGKLGDTLHTIFFDYTVNSAEWAEQVNGYTPSEGNKLLDVEITIKNTFGKEIPMGTLDFQMQWNDDADDAYTYQVQEITGENIMPETFDLNPDESVTYHVIYEVPEGYQEFSVATIDFYTNEDGEEVEGDAYFISFEMK